MTKEETLAYIKAYMDGDTSVGNIIPLRSVLESAIKYLSVPSLPSNLDEAAQKWKEENFLREYYQVPKDAMSCSFKAGAKWMAEQGETVAGIVTKIGDKLDVETTEYLIPEESEFEKCDKVIIQIRKKQ